MIYKYVHKTKKIYLITPHSEGFIDIEYKDSTVMSANSIDEILELL